MTQHEPATVWNDMLGRRIRGGGWADLAEGTVPLLDRALVAGDGDRITGLADMFLSEMRVIYDIYTQWFADTKRYLIDKGDSPEGVAAAHDEIRARLAPFHHSAGQDRIAVWDRIAAEVEVVTGMASPAVRRAALSRAHALWRDLHDGEVDQLCGLFDIVIRRHGEPALREMYEGWVIGDWFAKRYRRFDVSHMPWQEAAWLLTYLGFEGHHGHLSGTARDGSIDWHEDDEKITLSFAPCGSGGRSIAGEARDGLPALTAAPFNWPVLQEEHDFTWGKAGICSYCAHCCILHEALPVARFGYPVRVTDPPVWPLTGESRCRWTVYKDLRAIPEWAYTRVGGRKPGPEVPLGSGTADLRARLAAGEGP